MNGYILDTETTGQQEGAEIIEFAYGELDYELKSVGTVTCERFRPKRAILPGAMAVHHIIDEDLVGLKNFSEYAWTPPTFIIGHNVDFDWNMLGRPNCKRICTLALARAACPTEEGHSLGAWMYRIFPAHIARDMLKSAHNAGQDVHLCHELLHHLRERFYPELQTLGELWLACEEARIPKIWAFGKHKGIEIAKTDTGYLSWVLRQADFDPYIKTACKRALGK